MRSLLRVLALTSVASGLVAGSPNASADPPKPDLTRLDLAKDPTLFVLNYSHLDTQWRWDYPWTIREDLRATLYDNFAIMAQDPSYVFNWTGAGRYQMFQEYYPEEYRTLKAYVAKGQWFPSGSAWEESDVNVPSSESLIRQLLMGHHFFKREFGTESSEFMLPDCFGFPASLPSILAHCGLKGFSTQKLTWGSAVGIPFNIGRWEGPDGRSVIAALNPGSYAAHLKTPLQSEAWAQRLEENGRKLGIKADLLYNGTGDEGGAPWPDSMATVREALASKGPVAIVAGRADQLFNAITPAQKAGLPAYAGDLELTEHSAGSITSQAFMKRANRVNELLADAAEKACVAADLLGACAYPADTLDKAWGLTLRSQFHDTLPGTSIPKAYEYAWNDGFIAARAFDGALTDAAGAVAAGMDTRVDGTPLVVFNPLGIAREDLVEALVPADLASSAELVAVDGGGRALPTQIITGLDGLKRVLFPGKVPAVGFAVFGLRAGKAPQGAELKAGDRTLENAAYRVTLNEAGDVASVFDKHSRRELLSAPMRLALQHEKPRAWPAWNMDWADRKNPPRAFVSGAPRIRIAESGPVRVALEIERESEGSRFVQTVRLWTGGDRVEFSDLIDWKTSESSLKATFPLTVSSPVATYTWDLGTLQRGNNDPKKYEVASHGWVDLATPKGDYGVTLLTGAKYGSDKPDDQTLRLTLLYTPGVRNAYREQRFQDWGRHAITYGLAGHAGDWRQGGAPWMAQRQDQPLVAFAAGRHEGPLGKSFSLIRVDSAQVSIQALKRAEDGRGLVIRLQELHGKAANRIHLQGAGPISEARELDGFERPLEAPEIKSEKGGLALDFTPYQIRTLGLRLGAPVTLGETPVQPIPLPYNLDAFSTNAHPTDGIMDGTYASYPAEMAQDTLAVGGVPFRMGPRQDGEKNAVECRGQSLPLPEGAKRIHLLMAATDGDLSATFKLGEASSTLLVPDWTGYLGSWDNRVFKDYVGQGSDAINSDLETLQGAFLKEARPAWWASHRHVRGRDEVYSYGYLFAFTLRVPEGARTLTLPANARVKVFAATAALRDDQVDNLRPLFPDFARDPIFKARFDKP